MTELQQLALIHLREEAYKAGSLYHQVANKHNFSHEVCTRDTNENEVSSVLSKINMWLDAIIQDK